MSSVSTGGPVPRAGGAPAAANVSVGAALALTSGRAVTVPLACGTSVYFGPFAFPSDPGKLAILTDHLSRTPAQVCAAGAWVDKDDVVIGAAGLGCNEGQQRPTRQRQEWSYEPASGGPTANPVYLKLWAEEGNCGRSDVTLTMQ